MQNTELSLLEKAIGHEFKNKDLLIEALTHSSYANESKAKKKTVRCNERLEFLGDAVLSSVVSEHIFIKYPDRPEGDLTQMRKAVVQSSALASYARSIGLGEFLYFGNGEEKEGGRDKRSNLEDAFEALVAAIYLDSGAEGKKAVRDFVIPFIEKELNGNYSAAKIDPKTELQQFIQQAEGDFLEYVIVDESGPDHNKVFVAEARLNSNMIGRGKGRSKREAEQNAAMEALRLFAQIKDEQEENADPQNHKSTKK